ncbi:MAG: helix-turn-helix protein [Holophagaceae bacterium]|nr:helix-turn-helix protein [Holophagaceae bacterium]
MVKGTLQNSGIASTLGGRIRMVRKAWGWTQKDLAQALDSDQQVVSYWERDRAKPSRSALILLSRVFQLPVEALTMGEGFSIPDLPSDPGPIGCIGALRQAIEALSHRAETGTIETIDLDTGSIGSLRLREAKAYMDRAQKHGCRVRIVVSQLSEKMESNGFKNFEQPLRCTED